MMEVIQALEGENPKRAKEGIEENNYPADIHWKSVIRR